MLRTTVLLHKTIRLSFKNILRVIAMLWPVGNVIIIAEMWTAIMLRITIMLKTTILYQMTIRLRVKNMLRAIAVLGTVDKFLSMLSCGLLLF